MEEKTYRVLIIEDESPISEVLSERLRNEGLDTVVAADGEEGLAMAIAQQPDAILLDILMPKKGGLTMLQELRATEEGRSIPVMMMTNLTDTEDINKALELGAFGYLVKSDWDAATVAKSIRHKLDKGL